MALPMKLSLTSGIAIVASKGLLPDLRCGLMFIGLGIVDPSLP
jgi:hypothetical protein